MPSTTIITVPHTPAVQCRYRGRARYHGPVGRPELGYRIAAGCFLARYLTYRLRRDTSRKVVPWMEVREDVREPTWTGVQLSLRMRWVRTVWLFIVLASQARDLRCVRRRSRSRGLQRLSDHAGWAVGFYHRFISDIAQSPIPAAIASPPEESAYGHAKTGNAAHNSSHDSSDMGG